MELNEIKVKDSQLLPYENWETSWETVAKVKCLNSGTIFDDIVKIEMKTKNVPFIYNGKGKIYLSDSLSQDHTYKPKKRRFFEISRRFRYWVRIIRDDGVSDFEPEGIGYKIISIE
jgi:hypothetical protein